MVMHKNVPGDSAFRRRKLRGTAIEPSYAGALSFFRRRYSRKLANVDVAVTGIPFDQSTTNRPGTRLGPEAIRRASAQHAWGPVWPWGFDPFDTLSIVDYGDCFFDWGDKESVPKSITRHVGRILSQNVFPLILGGDHSISYPVLKALHRLHGPLALVHFDAHRDLEDNPFPPKKTKRQRMDHGTVFRRAVDDGLILPQRSCQIGIRTCYHKEKSQGFHVFHADHIHQTPTQDIAQRICQAVGTHPTYLSIDIDCLDPAFAPGTGTPVPGGLSSYQVLSLLRLLTPLSFVGMDLVEVSPPFDHSEITANVASLIALEFLCLKALQKQNA